MGRDRSWKKRLRTIPPHQLFFARQLLGIGLILGGAPPAHAKVRAKIQIGQETEKEALFKQRPIPKPGAEMGQCPNVAMRCLEISVTQKDTQTFNFSSQLLADAD
jgi:hypothetical protein